jgi:hypothetical protein
LVFFNFFFNFINLKKKIKHPNFVVPSSHNPRANLISRTRTFHVVARDSQPHNKQQINKKFFHIHISFERKHQRQRQHKDVQTTTCDSRNKIIKKMFPLRSQLQADEKQWSENARRIFCVMMNNAMMNVRVGFVGRDE